VEAGTEGVRVEDVPFPEKKKLELFFCLTIVYSGRLVHSDTFYTPAAYAAPEALCFAMSVPSSVKYIFSLCNNTLRISMKFAGDGHHHPQIK